MRHNQHGANSHHNKGDLEERFGIFIIVHERHKDEPGKAYNKGKRHASHDNANEEDR